jgi:hypothetical protein
MTSLDPTDAPAESPDDDGRHDFDFWMGSWTQRNRKLTNALEPTCDDWVEFESTSEAWPTLGGLGNVDTLTAAHFPGIGSFEGMSWRLFDPATRAWSIWWASTTRPGVVDPPVVGRFDGTHGTFGCHDELDGIALEVRYEWDVFSADSARWQQSFSFDGGATWTLNWVIEHTRR